MKTPKIPQINLPEGTGVKLVKAGLLIAGIYFGKRELEKYLEKRAAEKADSQIDTDPAAGHARTLNAAMNPSGIDWMRSFDTTDTAAIYNIAPQISNLDKVKDYYKSQTEGRVLHEDLTKELGAEGYAKFLALATKGKTGDVKYSPVRVDIPANRMVITTAEANVRKTPKKESKYIPNNNIVKLAAKGKILGITTGKFAYDESNDVTFIEFWTLGLNVAGKHYFYVAKSQVELLTKPEFDKRQQNGKIPLEALAGVSTEPSIQTQVVSRIATFVYDESFRAIASVTSNIIIGFPIMTLNTGKDKYIKLQTVQGKTRWVNAADVVIQNRT